MDQLLVHQLLSILPRLKKRDDNVDHEDLQQKANNLLERILSGKFKDARISLGVLLINSIDSKCFDIAHRLLDYIETNEDLSSLRLPIVNYQVSGRLTSLHSAASSSDGRLVQRLLALGASPWQPSIKGELAFHRALSKYEAQLHSTVSSDILYSNLERLTAAMLANVPENDRIDELVRRHALVPRLLNSSDVPTLGLLRSLNAHSDDAANCFYLDYALQNGACDERVIEYLLEQVKQTWPGLCLASIPVSPLDLCLNYGNLRAASRALDLGFELSRTFFRSSAHVFRHVLVCEEDVQHFPKARRLFDHLMDKMLAALDASYGDESQMRNSLKMLQDLTSVSVRYFAQSESFVNNRHRTYVIQQTGNLLTYSLMNHCGHMARRLLELPVRWPPLEIKMLQYYQFSRWDMLVIKDLLEADLIKMIDFISFHPRYMPLSRSYIGRISDRLRHLILANETEDNAELADYLRFLEWHDVFREQIMLNKRGAKSLQVTCRDYLVTRFLAFDPRRGSLQQFATFLQRRKSLERELPRAVYEDVFKSINLVKL